MNGGGGTFYGGHLKIGKVGGRGTFFLAAIIDECWGKGAKNKNSCMPTFMDEMDTGRPTCVNIFFTPNDPRGQASVMASLEGTINWARNV